MPPRPSAKASPFGLYVSPVRDHLVRRFGAPSAEQIGTRAQRLLQGRDPVLQLAEIDPDEVVPLTHAEVAKYGREYRTAIREGALKERKEADWQAWSATLAARKQAAIDRYTEAREALAKKLQREPAEVSDPEVSEYLAQLAAETATPDDDATSEEGSK